MTENNYAFAVAQIRSLENSLFTRNAFEQILSAKEERDILDILLSHGYKLPFENATVNDIIDHSQSDVYELLKGHMKDAPALKLFTVKNDFHNLKTVIKGLAGETAFEENIISPSTVDTATLKTAISEKKYDLLPGLLETAAKESMETLGAHFDGQMADAVIDKYTLLAYKDIAEESDSKMVKEYVDAVISSADIKTAFRGAKTHRSEEFYNNALCGSISLDKTALTRAARKGEDDVITYITSVGFAKAAAALKVSLFEFEKAVDQKIMRIIDGAVFENFSIDPLIAYGIKRENEIKNLRICIAGVRTGDIGSVTERMCLPDV